jgi:putative spermidine/putrescine transport system ATP-binding protein
MTYRSKKSFVVFSGVHKTYDGQHFVASNLNFEIEAGEFLSLLGPSGSGKTTTLMMLAGFESPTEGAILLDDQYLNDLPPHRRGIGMVFQNYALFPHMTVAENIAFPLTVRRLPRAEIAERVQRALDMVELGRVGGSRPQQLSGGQQQRVALARALVFEPRLVLMDEPLGALDKSLRESMQYEIKRLHDRLNVTIVYVTHDQGEALTMSDRVAVFHFGRIQQIATPRTLYENPSNAFVANFVGENNGLAGEVSQVARDRATLGVAPGVVVRGRAGQGIAAGERGVLALRPENVSFGAVEGAENVLSGRIDEIIYSGDHWRLRLSVAGSDDFIVRTPNRAAVTPPQPGEAVTVSWRADDCQIVAEAA